MTDIFYTEKYPYRVKPGKHAKCTHCSKEIKIAYDSIWKPKCKECKYPYRVKEDEKYNCVQCSRNLVIVYGRIRSPHCMRCWNYN